MRNPITDPQEAAACLKGLFESHESAVFFGGAGVSTASGIPDFRSENGLYQMRFETGHSPEFMLSHTFWRDYRGEFFDFYRTCMIAPEAKPNRCHLKLAELEREGALAAVVTQNIDGLHQAAGSKNVFELHGSVHRNVCRSCGAVYGADWVLARESEDGHGVPICPACGSDVKPDVVLYEEPLDEAIVEGAVAAIASADLLVVGGTSLAVYPAAGLLQYFNGDALAIVNMEPTPQDRFADVLVACDISVAFDF